MKPEQNTKKKAILDNYKFVLLDDKTKKFRFIKDQEEIDILMANNSISDKDVIVNIGETIQVAQSINQVILN